MTKAERDAMMDQYNRMGGIRSLEDVRIITILTAECDRLEAENEALQKQIAGHVDRIAGQAELLSKRAEK